MSGTDEPTIVFVFELKKWYELISPLTKIELIDIAPIIGYQFFFDYQSGGYALVITKSKWDNVSQEAKRRFMSISRRIKEEIEGPLLSVQRDIYESADLFDLYSKQKQVQDEEPTVTETTVIDTTVISPEV